MGSLGFDSTRESSQVYTQATRSGSSNALLRTGEKVPNKLAGNTPKRYLSHLARRRLEAKQRLPVHVDFALLHRGERTIDIQHTFKALTDE